MPIYVPLELVIPSHPVQSIQYLSLLNLFLQNSERKCKRYFYGLFPLIFAELKENHNTVHTFYFCPNIWYGKNDKWKPSNNTVHSFTTRYWKLVWEINLFQCNKHWCFFNKARKHKKIMIYFINVIVFGIIICY